MKTLVAALVLLVALVGCCTHPVEVAALERAGTEMDKIGVSYLKYVDADPVFGGQALTPEQRKEARKNEKAWVERVKGIVTSVKKSLED